MRLGVGSFIFQSETTSAIQELLAIFNDYNATWKPWYFSTDFCQEEIIAIKQTFTGREFIIKIENVLSCENKISHLGVG